MTAPIAEAREGRRLGRACQRAGEDEREGVTGEPQAERARLLLPGRRQRHVGPAGVTAETRPLGLTVAGEPDGRAPSSGPARSRRPQVGVRTDGVGRVGGEELAWPPAEDRREDDARDLA